MYMYIMYKNRSRENKKETGFNKKKQRKQERNKCSLADMEGGGGGGRSTLSEIYQDAKKVVLRTRDAVERLERLEYSSAGMESPPELSSSIARDITHIQSLCVEMDRLCRSLPSKSHRDLWKR